MEKSLGFNIAKQFASLLDHNKFNEAKAILHSDCQYEYDGKIISGPEKIIESYAVNYQTGKSKFDEIIFTSEVTDLQKNNCFLINYTDDLRREDRWHRYRCQQQVQVKDGLINYILHIEIPNEKEQLNNFIINTAKFTYAEKN